MANTLVNTRSNKLKAQEHRNKRIQKRMHVEPDTKGDPWPG